MFKKLKTYFTKTIYIEYRPLSEYKLIRNGKYYMHKGLTDTGESVYEYAEIDGKPIACHYNTYLEIFGESEYTPISLDALDPDAPLTSSLSHSRAVSQPRCRRAHY